MEHETEEMKLADVDTKLSPSEQTKFLCKRLEPTSLGHLNAVNQDPIKSLDCQGKYFYLKQCTADLKFWLPPSVFQ